MALLNEINVKGVPHPIVTDDGYYQEMTVGDAEQLVATTFTEDDAPYNFRTAGGAIDIGDRKQVEGIVGGTVAWNQQHKNFSADLSMAAEGGEYTITNGVVTFTANSSGSTHRVHRATLATQVSLVVGHKYLQEVSVKADSSCVYGVSGLNASEAMDLRITGNGTWQTRSKLFIADANNATAYIALYNFQTSDFTPIQMKAPQLFDLTQMFGSTIADYIYALEQANAGAGVAWFKKFFPKPYYAYNAGELMSVKALRHITRGFNAWDEETELGGISSTNGSPYADNTKLRSKNFCGVLPNTNYYFEKPTNALDIFFYDAEKNFVSVTYTANRVITTPSNAHYVKIALPTAYGTTYNHDICINLSWDGERNGEYEEYVEHVYELDPDLELRGIPKLSAGNDLYYDGDVYEPDGTVTRTKRVIDLNDAESFESIGVPAQTASGVYYCDIYKRVADRYGTDDAPAICFPYPIIPTTTIGKTGYAKNYTSAITVYDDVLAGMTDSQAKAYLISKGFKVVFDLPVARHTIETADPYTNPQIVNDFGTEEFVDAGVAASTPTRDVAIPVGHNTKYQPNLRAKLEMAPESPEDNGYYVVYHHDGINEYVPLIIPQELPELPTEDGTYTLKCTVASGSATLSFESEV